MNEDERQKWVRQAAGSLAGALTRQKSLGRTEIPRTQAAQWLESIRALDAALKQAPATARPARAEVVPPPPAVRDLDLPPREVAAAHHEAAPASAPAPAPTQRSAPPDERPGERQSVPWARPRPAVVATQTTMEPVTVMSPPGVRRTLDEIRTELGDCQRCKLCSGRTQIVFGTGNPQARLMFIGEGPGENEDQQGEPFVGRAGKLLTDMIGAMGLERSDVYIANVVKCRPPENRNPEPDEVAACLPFLEQQVMSVKPEVIVLLGGVAYAGLLGRTVSITRERGQWTSWKGVDVMPTLHPAYLLRNEGAKRDAWSDLKQVMGRLSLVGRTSR
jgi:DNA polymerase